MSYPDTHDGDFLHKLLSKKEFYRMRADPTHNYRDPPGGSDSYAGKYLKLHSYQLFVRDFMSPNTSYRSLHLQFQTGTGKTLVACGTAHEHIRAYKSIYAIGAARAANNRRLLHTLDRTTPSIVVLGFGGTKKAFMRDLLKHPEFEFVTTAELDELASRRRMAELGHPADVSAAKEYNTMLRRRITNKQRGGFYRFFGYDEFVNRLFTTTTIKLIDIEAETLSRIRAGEETTHDEVFAEYIKSGKVSVNTDFLLSLRNNFVIADEIHNTYNTTMRNNRGVALQYALDTVESLRLLTMSATPVNNSPTEIVELVNYHVLKADRITKQQIFSGPRTLREGGIEKIIELMKGRWSFLQDANVKYFPKQIFHGEDVILPQSVGAVSAGQPIPYLKFTACEMSPLHAATLSWWKSQSKSTDSVGTIIEAVANDTSDGIVDDNTTDDELSILSNIKDSTTITDAAALDTTDVIDATDALVGIPADGVTLYDGVFPNPDTESIGLFRSMETRAKIASAPRDWADRNQISVRKTSMGWTFTGGFLAADKIGKYCTKAVKLLEIIDEVFNVSGGDPNKCQKMMIYHDRVKMMGIMFWAELLRTNGFIDETSDPVDATRCVACGVPLGRHSVDGCTHYYPARFVVAHSDIDKTTMDTSINKFIQPENAHGLQYMVLLGSKIIKESYDIKDVQVFIQTSTTVNFSTLLQIFGRTARKGSHLNLPEDQRAVHVYILLSTGGGTITPEMQRYADKASDYMVIQQIERELNASAIDANINRDIIMSPELMQKYIGPDGKIQQIMGNLYFDPVDTLPQYTPGELNLSTWTAYGYNKEETHMIIVLLKRMFIQTPVWTWDGILAAIRQPSVGVEVNPKLFFTSNIIIALQFLLSPRDDVVQLRGTKSSDLTVVEHLFDASDRYVYVDGRKHAVIHRGKYYVRTPVQQWGNRIGRATGRDQEHLLVASMEITTSRVVATDLSWLNWQEPTTQQPIPTDEWLRNHNIDDLVKQAFNTISAQNYVINDQFIFYWSFTVQIKMLEHAIEYVVRRPSMGLSPERAAEIIAVFDKFGAIIRRGNLIEETPGDAEDIIGYHDKRRIRLLIEENWKDNPKSALKKRPTWIENDILIGYIEMADGEVRFKLRKPAKQIREEVSQISAASGHRKTASKRVGNVDTRFMERGAVCVNKPKSDMIKFAASLGAPIAQFSGAQRVKTICDVISAKLIEKEQEERKKGSKIKYFYGWWDEMPSLAIF